MPEQSALTQALMIALWLLLYVPRGKGARRKESCLESKQKVCVANSSVCQIKRNNNNNSH